MLKPELTATLPQSTYSCEQVMAQQQCRLLLMQIKVFIETFQWHKVVNEMSLIIFRLHKLTSTRLLSRNDPTGCFSSVVPGQMLQSYLKDSKTHDVKHAEHPSILSCLSFSGSQELSQLS